MFQTEHKPQNSQQINTENTSDKKSPQVNYAEMLREQNNAFQRNSGISLNNESETNQKNSDPAYQKNVKYINKLYNLYQQKKLSLSTLAFKVRFLIQDFGKYIKSMLHKLESKDQKGFAYLLIKHSTKENLVKCDPVLLEELNTHIKNFKNSGLSKENEVKVEKQIAKTDFAINKKKEIHVNLIRLFKEELTDKKVKQFFSIYKTYAYDDRKIIQKWFGPKFRLLIQKHLKAKEFTIGNIEYLYHLIKILPSESERKQYMNKLLLVNKIDTKADAPRKDRTEGDVVENVHRYNFYIKMASQKYGVPENRIKAIIATESGGEKNIDNKTAYGLMQVTEGTWNYTQNKYKELNVYDFNTYRYDPWINILFGTRILKDKASAVNVSASHSNYIPLAITAYNAGENTIKSAIEFAKADKSKDPYQDCLKEKYLKKAVEKKGIYSFYLTGKGKNQNTGKTKSERKQKAIDLKVKEIMRYPNNYKSYLKQFEKKDK